MIDDFRMPAGDPNRDALEGILADLRAACFEVVTVPSPGTVLAAADGSTRPGRKAEAVARWVHEHASKRTDARFELVDIAAYDLPLLDEPAPPAMGKYSKEHTKKWAAKIASLDAFVFVTPEYNQIADVRAQVALSLRDDFESYTTFKPSPHHEKTLSVVFDQVIRWGTALKTLRPA